MAETKNDIKSVMGVDVLMQGVLGKLYAVLTSGDEVAPKSEDNFFAWATPGFPVKESDYDFASLGLSGEIIDKDELNRRVLDRNNSLNEARLASGQEQVEVDADSIIAEEKDAMQKENVHFLRNRAANFAFITDFIPDVSGTSPDGRNATLRTEFDEGTLSDVYNHVLQYSQVKSGEIDKETQEKIDKIRKEIEDTVEEKVDILGEKELVITKSKIKSAYDKYRDIYDNAAMEYTNQRINGMYGDLAARQAWTFNGKTFRNRLLSALDDWNTMGYKSKFEKMSAYITQIEERDLSLLKRKYKQLFDDYHRSTDSGEFYYTTLSPADFATSSGWTKFTFNGTEIHEFSKSDYHAKSSKIKTSSGSIFHRHKTENTHEENHLTYNSEIKTKNFHCSFEVCQVKIVRPWFKPSFLNSKYWRFDENTAKGDILSDGGMPPKGMMPAYPTSIIFIRNLNIFFGEGSDIGSYISKYEKDTAHYGGGLNIGWFNIKAKASYGSSETDGSSEGKRDYEYNDQSIRVPGMQIIGFNCHIFGKSPDPHPDIKKEDWV